MDPLRVFFAKQAYNYYKRNTFAAVEENKWCLWKKLPGTRNTFFPSKILATKVLEWVYSTFLKKNSFATNHFFFISLGGQCPIIAAWQLWWHQKKPLYSLHLLNHCWGMGCKGKRRWWCLPFAKKSARKAGRKVLCKTAFACKTNQQNLHFYVWGAAAFLGKIVIRVGN